MRLDNLWRSVSITTLALSLPLSLVAQEVDQDNDQDETTVYDTITVTAQKREQSIEDVPFLIQAVGGAELEERGIDDFRDIISIVPSATFTQSFHPAQSVVAIRGVGNSSEGTSPTSFYVDDTPFASLSQSEAPPLDLYDMERIEVLKGPQGTLYGQAAMGGTIRLITAEPVFDEVFGKGQVNYHTLEDGDQGWSASGALNLPLVEDKLALRVSGTYKERAKFIDQITPAGAVIEEDVNFYDTYNMRAKLVWTPNDKLLVRLSGLYSETDNLGGHIVTQPAENRGNSGFEAALQQETGLYSAFVSYDLGFATLEETLSYQDYRISQQAEITGLFSTDFFVDSEVVTNEIRLVSNDQGPIEWITGFYYQDGKRSVEQEGQFFGVPNPFEVSELDTESWAIYGEASKSFADDLIEVLVGLRYFEDERPFQQTLDGVSAVDDVQTTETLNPRLNVTYRPTENGLYYLNIAKGFRPGGVNTVAVQNASAIVGLTRSARWESDELWTYEVGTKQTLFDGDLYFEGAIYHTDWEDTLLQIANSTGVAVATNIGDAKLTGVEFLAAAATPIEGLDFGFNANYFIDTELKISDPIVLAAAADPTSGIGFSPNQDMPGTPEWTVGFNFDYERPITQNTNFTARYDFRYRDEQSDITNPLLFADSLTFSDLRLGVEQSDGNWSVQVYVNNMFDEDGIEAITFQSFVAAPRPREIGITLNKRFN